MAEPTELVRSSAIAYSISTGLFVTIMLLAYSGFGNLGPDNIIVGMREDRPAGWWALNKPWQTGTGDIAGTLFAWMIILNLIMTDAIYVPCTVKTFESAAPAFFANRFNWFALRIFISGFRLLVATSVKSFVALTSLTSAMFCVNINVLIPIAAYYKTADALPGVGTRVAHGLIFLFGVFVLVLGSYGAIMSIVDRPAEDKINPGTVLRNHITAACKAAFELANNSRSNNTLVYG